MIFRRRLLGVLGQLANEGLLTDEQLAHARTESAKTASATPWFVRVLVGAGAWIASLLLIVLLVLIEVLRSEVGAIVSGLFLLAAGGTLRRLSRGDFLVQLALAFGLAGATLVVGGTAWSNSQDVAAPLVVAFLIALAVIAVFPDTVMRFIATCVASGATVLMCHQLSIGPDVAVGVIAVLAGLAWIYEPQLYQRPWLASLQLPVGFGLAFSLLAVLVASVTELDRDILVGRGAAISITVATLLLVFSIFREHRAQAFSEPALVAAGTSLALGVVMFASPGVMAAFFVAGLAFHRRNPVLLGLAILTLVAFSVFFYYRLEETLLLKSAVLCGSGLLLLGLREYVRRRYWNLPEAQLP